MKLQNLLIIILFAILFAGSVRADEPSLAGLMNREYNGRDLTLKNVLVTRPELARAAVLFAPVSYLDNIKTPIMLNHGMADQSVPFV